MENDKSYFALGILSAFLFGLSTPFSKYFLNYFNPFLLAGLLYLGGAIGLAPFIIKEKSLFKGLRNDKTKIIGSILFGGILGPVFLLFGLENTDSGSVSLWLNMELVWTALLGALIFKDTITRKTAMGLFFMVATGILMVLYEGIGKIQFALFIILACFCWGIDNQLTSVIEHVSPSHATFIKALTAGSVNTIIGLLNMIELGDFPWIIIVYAMLVGSCSYGLSIVLYIITAQQIGATRGQILFSSAPIISLILSTILLHESFLIIHVVAIILTIFGIYYINKSEHQHLHKHSHLIHDHRHTHNDLHHEHSHEGISVKNKSHKHEHEHDNKDHSHDHYPDIHHRHTD